ncbi:FG-GAP repeat protein [Microlunatus spumicola]|uniref:FG-GAP repeat protein n=1 Tax=Microlunatus spumicola TaxID=81499 RepID=UPI00195740BC
MKVRAGLPLVVAVAAGLVVSGLAAPSALASTDCAFDAAAGTTADVQVFGLPRTATGAVEVRAHAGVPAQRIPGTAGTGFGTSLATAFVDSDHCADLAVGAPTAPGGGAVQVFLGAADGYATTPALTLRASSAADRFGSDLALRERSTGGVDVWVGAPGRTVAGHARAGAVDHFLITADGGARRLETITAADARHGQVQSSTGFGGVLAASGEGLLVGVPGHDVGRKKDAGAAYWYPLDTSTGSTRGGTMWTQSSAKVPGSPEGGDHFGAAVAVSRAGSPRWVLVGVPDEDLGKKKDTGSVQTFALDPVQRALIPRSAVDETHADAATRNTAGDRFGAAVAVDDGTCLGGGWLVGAPGRNAGKKADSGAFFSVRVPGSSCTSVRYTQRDLSQHDEKGDRFGSAIALLGRPAPDLDPVPVSQTVLVGTPGEDSASGVSNSGSVTSWALAEQRDEDGRPALAPFYQFFSASGAATRSLAFGSVLPDADTFVRH